MRFNVERTELCCKGILQGFCIKTNSKSKIKKQIELEETLTPRPKTSNNRIPIMVVTYHPGVSNIGGILTHLQSLLHCSDKCKKAIKEAVPLMPFRRSLGYYLVHPKQNAPTAQDQDPREQ